MTLPGLKTNRTTTHNTAQNPHSNPTPEWLHPPQQYEPGEKSRVPSAVPDHCRPPELCPSVSCTLPCVPVSAERVPGSGVPHSSHPCLPGCTWARTRAKKPPVIPLTSALPPSRHPPNREIPQFLTQQRLGWHELLPSSRIPSTRGVCKGGDTTAKLDLAGWRRGKPHIHGHRGGKEPVSKQDENPILAALPFHLPTFKGGFSCSPVSGSKTQL